VMAGALSAQQQPGYYQVLNCIKVTTGKTTEYLKFVNDASKPLAQARANAGEIVSWSLLRSVLPTGEEARCDYSIVTTYEGPIPPPPVRREDLPKALERASIKMTAAEYYARRDAVSHLVATELWRTRIRLGQPQKGNYVFLNYMKVHDLPGFTKFETDVWRPLAEGWIKEGTQTGWVFNTALLPGGTEIKYAAVTADIYPSWEATFQQRNTTDMFKKAHPGKDLQQTMAPQTKLRDLAQRNLMIIEERVTKK